MGLNFKIDNPPYEYDFLINLDEREYPKYLAKIYEFRTGKKLPLEWSFRGWRINKSKCKTFNEKIQWLKLYDATPLKKLCTDKVTVRDYVKEKIGAQYLKPVLGIFDSFDEIDFEKLPESFVMKCSHGCKWQFIIRDKKEFLRNKRMFSNIREQMNGWMEQEFWAFEGFEMQYKGLVHKIIIEPYMCEDLTIPQREIEVFCFSGMPEIILNIQFKGGHRLCAYNKDLTYSDFIVTSKSKEITVIENADELTKQTIDISIELSKDFKFVRVDYMVYQNKLYFEELTFSVCSGFCDFDDKWSKKFGDLIEI